MASLKDLALRIKQSLEDDVLSKTRQAGQKFNNWQVSVPTPVANSVNNFVYGQPGQTINRAFNAVPQATVASAKNLGATAKQVSVPVLNTMINGVNSFNQIGNSKFNPAVLAASQVPQFRNTPTAQPNVKDFLNVGKAGLVGTGAVVGPAFGAGSAAFGGAIQIGQNVVNRRPLVENVASAAGEGLNSGLMAAPVVGATNPLLNKLISPVAGKYAPRLAAGVANAAQGTLISASQGNPITPQGLAIDLATGAVGGKGQFGKIEVNKNNLFGRERELQLNADELVKFEKILQNKKAYTKAQVDEAIQGIYALGDRHLPAAVKDKLVGKPQQILKAVMKELDKPKPQVYPTEWTKNSLMGFADNSNPKQFAKDMEAMPKGFDETLGAVPAGANANARPNIELNTDPQTGTIKSELGMTGNVKSSFADWVNARKASKLEGYLKSQEFTNLDDKGLTGFLEFQAGNKTGKYAPLKKYFDNKYNELQKAGVEFNYRKDYLPQLWQNSDEEVQRVFGRTLSQRPKFTLEAVLKSYEEGLQAGLTPKFGKTSDLVRWYEQTANKSIADVGFFKKLGEEQFILPASKAPHDWVTLAPDNFPKIKVSTAEGNYAGTYKAPKEVADMINNYLENPKHELIAKLADFASTSKNRMLSFGIPGTAMNAHGFNILARSAMANPVKGLKTFAYMLNPNMAASSLEKNLSKAPFAIRNGLTFSTEKLTQLTDEPMGVRSKIGAKWGDLFEKGLFDKMLPALKLDKFYEVYDGYKKSMPEKEAARAAAKFTNDLFGGINWEELGKSRDTQNFKRMLILAPDWLETNINLGKNIGKSFIKITDPKLAAYRKFAAGAMGAYVTANVTNKLLSGKWMFQNEPGNTFNIDTGTYTEDGQKRYIRVFGTAADFARIPADVAVGLAKGDPSVAFRALRNRLSTLASPLVGLATNTDYLGNAIYGKDKYGNQMSPLQSLQGVGSELSTFAGVPAFTKNAADIATGKVSPEAGLVTGLELPVRYSGGIKSTVQKQANEVNKLSGKDLYDRNVSLRGQTKFSDNQMEALKSGNVKITDVLDKRASDSEERKIKEQISESGSGQIAGKKYYYKKDNGDIGSVNLEWKAPTLKLTGNEQLDKKARSAFSSDISSRATDVYTLYEQGVITQKQAETELDNLAKLKDSISTKKGGVRVSKGQVNYSTPKLSKSSTPKLQPIRIAKVPAVKMSKPKQISVSVGSYKVPAIKVKSFANTLKGGQTKLA